MNSVIGDGIDIELLLWLIPCNRGVEMSHTTVGKQKMVYLNLGVKLWFSKNSGEKSTSGGMSAESYSCEINQVKDIGDVDIFEVYHQRVAVSRCRYTRNIEMLGLVGECQTADRKAVIAIDKIGGVYLPGSVADKDFGRQDMDMGRVLLLLVFVKLSLGTNGSL